MQWPLLADVPEEEVRLVLSVARRRRFGRGEVVFHRDDPGDSLHLIAAGHFAIKVMTPLGDTVTIGVRGPGENFGEMALVQRAGPPLCDRRGARAGRDVCRLPGRLRAAAP